jgi:predicted permease
VLVLSYNEWQHSFGGDPAVVGRHLYEPYSEWTYTIVGVAPPGLDYPTGAGYWIAWPDANVSVIAVARLAPGVASAAARAELFSIIAGVEPQLHLTGAKATPFTQAVVGDVQPVLIVLLSAVGLLLLMACVNVGNLLLLRATSRGRELAVRRAIGASYGDIVRQLLIESGLLGIAGGALGVVCAITLLKVLLAFAPAQLPRVDVIQLHGAPVGIAVGVTLVAVLLFGVAPALLAARTDLASALRLDARSGFDSARRRRVRQVLVGSQMALALVMLCGAALLGRSLSRLQSLDLGFRADHLSILGLSWPSLRYGSSSKLYPIGEELTRRWRSIPGVVAVTPVYIPPLLGDNVFLSRLDVEGQSPDERDSNPIVPVEAGGGEYFRTFGILIRRGRAFTDADRENTPLVAVVSEGVARRLWPGQDPIGKRIHHWQGADSTAWRTVIGVAADAHLRTLRTVTPAVYIPWRQGDFFQNNFAIRTTGPLVTILPALRREARAFDPQFNLWYTKTMDELLAAPLAQPRTSALLMSLFGFGALALAAIGLYGLMAAVVRSQTREIGVRMALGATPDRLRREVLARALGVSAAGGLAGVVVALWGSRLLTALLFRVSPTDPASIAGSCAVLLGVAAMAAYLPARWATKVDPARALRAD